MPLIAHSSLPSFGRLENQGEMILSKERASHQDIRELHIGLLNMMPDAALEATERQFFRLIGHSNQVAQFYMHPFSLQSIERGEKPVSILINITKRLKKSGLRVLMLLSYLVQTSLTQTLRALPFMKSYAKL